MPSQIGIRRAMPGYDRAKAFDHYWNSISSKALVTVDGVTRGMLSP